MQMGRDNLKIQTVSQKTINAINDTLPHFIENNTLTISELAEKIGKDYSTASRRIKDLENRGMIKKNYEKYDSVNSYKITFYGIVLYLRTSYEKGKPDLVFKKVDIIAKKHPDKFPLFKYLEYFKDKGYDLRIDLLLCLFQEINLKSSFVDAMGIKLPGPLVYPLELTARVLHFYDVSIHPDIVERSLIENNLSLDWLLGLWKVSDTIKEFYELRRSIQNYVETDANRVLDNIENWYEIETER
jgi:DNA-binding Lrp family transcriptional regulator